TFPTLLAASGVRYLASGVNPERAAPLLSPADAARAQLGGGGGAGDWTTYPQLYWWEGPDGSRVLHWRSDQYADGSRFGFDVDAAEMGRRLSDWLLTHPVFLSPGYPYDIALLSGATGDNGLLDERVVANVEEFARRFAYPRLVAARPEDFFREVERRWGTKLPVRRGDTGCYREDGAASTAAELGRYRAAQLVARAAELLALWDEQTEPPGASCSTPRAGRGATCCECPTARHGGSPTTAGSGRRWICPTGPPWSWHERSPRWAIWRSRKVSERQTHRRTTVPRSKHRPGA